MAKQSKDARRRRGANRLTMKIKRLKNIKINCYDFKINWTKEHGGGDFSYKTMTINIGTKDASDSEIFMILCHELMEIVATEMNVRLCRPDCYTDFIFVYDHRQHETMMNMFSGLISQFIKG